ncbi:MAG: aldo/keto reductase [Bacteroidota bacterium]|jgi:aryl-alcohol dehydrogenase-like predicted oxidoreductase
MNYKLLGKSGLRVSELCLGTMTFGEEWGWGASAEECRKMYDAYRSAGGNFIDTANRYTEGTSEKIVGELIAQERESIVLATKYTLKMKDNDPNWSGNHRKNMMQSLHHSLKRLKTDYIDLYWLHAWDYTTPVDEILRALDDAVRAGKILYIGISDTPAWIVSQMNTIAELRGWSRFVGLQIEYSLVQRTVERELIPMAKAFDMAVLAWSPLGTGVLTGKYSGTHPGATRLKEGSARLSERNLAIAQEVIAVAGELGVSPSQAAIAWILHQEGVMIPIIGGTTAAHIQDNLGSLSVRLTDAQVKRLNDISAIELGFPYEFLNSNSIRNIIYSGTYDKIHNHRKL